MGFAVFNIFLVRGQTPIKTQVETTNGWSSISWGAPFLFRFRMAGSLEVFFSFWWAWTFRRNMLTVDFSPRSQGLPRLYSDGEELGPLQMLAVVTFCGSFASDHHISPPLLVEEMDQTLEKDCFQTLFIYRRCVRTERLIIFLE